MKNLKSFFRKHLYLASSRECLAIIRRLDLDADARLNLKEFTEGLKPSAPYSKMLKRIEIKRRSRSKSNKQFNINESTATSHKHSAIK